MLNTSADTELVQLHQLLVYDLGLHLLLLRGSLRNPLPEEHPLPLHYLLLRLRPARLRLLQEGQPRQVC